MGEVPPYTSNGGIGASGAWLLGGGLVGGGLDEGGERVGEDHLVHPTIKLLRDVPAGEKKRTRQSSR